MRLREQNFYTIKLPKINGIGYQGCVQVTNKSPFFHKKAVERMALYFKREFSYDFLQFRASDEHDEEEHSAWMFVDCEVVIGACCFIKEDYKDIGERWVMGWIWIHPFCRRTGILTKYWDIFVEKFENFLPALPLSKAMKSFLEKIKYEPYLSLNVE